MRGHDALEPVVGAQDRELAGVAVRHVQDRVDRVRFHGVRRRLVLARERPARQDRVGEAAAVRPGGRSVRHPALPAAAPRPPSTHARRHASPVTRVWREAVVVPESGVVAVSGSATCTRSASRPRTSQAICARTVARPWPTQAAPERISTRSPSTRTTHLPMSRCPTPSPVFLNAQATPARPRSGLEALLHREQAFLEGGVGPASLSVGERVAGPHRVAPPYLPRREPGLHRQGIERALEGEVDLWNAETAERPGRRIVGVHRDPFDVDVRAGVGSAGVGDGAVEDRAAERCVRAGVGRDPLPQAHEHAALVAAEAEVDGHGVPLDVDPRALGPPQGALHRPFREPREQGRDVLDGLVFLSAVRPSHVRRDHAHLFRGKAERVGDVPSARRTRSVPRCARGPRRRRREDRRGRSRAP